MKNKTIGLLDSILGNESLETTLESSNPQLTEEARLLAAAEAANNAQTLEFAIEDTIEENEVRQEHEEELEELVEGMEHLLKQPTPDLLTIGLLYNRADKLNVKLSGKSTLPKDGMEGMDSKRLEAYMIVGQEGFMETLKSGAKAVKDFIVKLYRMVRDWIKSFFTGSNSSAEIAKESAEITANMEREVARSLQLIKDANELFNFLDRTEDQTVKVDKQIEETVSRLREIKPLPEFKVGTTITPKEREETLKKLKKINLKTLTENITSPRKVSKSKFLNNPKPIKSLNLLPNEITLKGWDQFIALEEGPNSTTVKTLMSIIDAISEVDFPRISSLVPGSGGRPSDWKPLIKILEQLNKLFGLLKSISGAKVSSETTINTEVLSIDTSKEVKFEYRWPENLYKELISMDPDTSEFWKTVKLLVSRTGINFSRGHEYKPRVIKNPCKDYSAVNKLVSSRADIIEGSDKPVTKIVDRQKAFFRDGEETALVKKLDFLEASLRDQPKENTKVNIMILGGIENAVSGLPAIVKKVYGVGIQIHKDLGVSLKSMTKELTRTDWKKLEESDEFKKFNEFMLSGETLIL